MADDRAQSMTYMLAGATLVMVALAYAVLQSPIESVLAAGADQCVSEACKTGNGYASDAWGLLPVAVVGLVALLIIAASIYKSRGPR